MERLLANPKLARAQQHRALRVLAIAATLLILLISALMSVSAVREAVFKFFTELYEKYIVAWYEPEDSSLTAPETILEFREPTYIPQGFVQTMEEKIEIFHIQRFANAEGMGLLFEQTILNRVQYALDLKDESDKILFECRGIMGMYRITDEQLELIWSDNEYTYRISGIVTKEQALLMVDSIK
jgi:hypothetical protein